MTAWTSNEPRAAPRVPGVYFEPRPREPEPARVRTDVAGFIGFEPRLRAGSSSMRLLGPPPPGHRFALALAAFQLVVAGVRVAVPATTDLVLSEDATAVPVAPGE